MLMSRLRNGAGFVLANVFGLRHGFSAFREQGQVKDFICLEQNPQFRAVGSIAGSEKQRAVHVGQFGGRFFFILFVPPATADIRHYSIENLSCEE